MQNPLDYYATHKAALFPIPAGQKDPHGIVESWKHDHSSDPAQWAAWRLIHPNCNFGVVAFASQWIIVDIDTSGGDAGKAEAWALWVELCKSWGLPDAIDPQVQSARGGWHVYFAVPPHIDASTLRQPDAIKGRINLRCVGYTVAAGSYYDGTAKGEESGPYTLFDNAPAPHPAPQALIDHCTRAERAATQVLPGSHDKGDVGNLLRWLGERDGFDAYEDWVNAGMALKLEYGDDGLSLWALTHNDTVTPDVIETKWKSFATDATAQSVTLNSFFDRAHKLGWKGTVRPSVSSMFAGVGQYASAAPGMPTPTPSAPAKTNHLLSSGAFVRGFVPPDYLVDGILQRRFCYSLTAQTGVGKTTVAMRVAAHVAIGKSIGGLDVERGTVVYFAGENPTDIQMRWLGLTKEMGLDPDSVDVHFIPGTKKFSETAQEIEQEIVDNGLTPSLIVVDTAAAFFEGDNDNDNVQAGNHARMLRSLTQLQGGPCVLILCHPTKNAADDNLVPRGGGAFLNEVDGNIALRRDDDTVIAAALGKFRGPEFTPINFALKVVRNHPLLKDTKGRQIPTIIAEPITAAEQQRIETTARTDKQKVLEALCNQPGAGPVDIAKVLGWSSHSKVSRMLPKLLQQGLLSNELGNYVVTPKGQKALNVAASVAAAPPIAPYVPPLPADLNGAAYPTPAMPRPPMPPG